MVNTFDAAGSGRTHMQAPVLSHQERVNVEMFKAIETLGRKLERAEGERDRLQRRLALIESAATVDEKTGKLYLPVMTDPALPVPAASAAAASRWAVAASLMSSALALFAVGIVLFRDPAPGLSPRQVAVLEELMSQKQMAGLALEPPATRDTPAGSWKSLRDLQAEEDAARDAEKRAAALARATETAELERRAAAAAATADEEKPAMPDIDLPALTAIEESLTRPIENVTEVIQARPAEETPVAPQQTAEQQQAIVDALKEKVAEKQKLEAEITRNMAVSQTATPVTSATTVIDETHTQNDTLVERGVTADPNLPVKLAELEKRAFADNAEAQHDLATIYASGKTVARDYKRAAYWFARAADGGVANAHYNLGVMFQQGLGVKEDVRKAIGWYEKAAELGHPEAMYNLGIAYIEGVGTERNTDRGISFFKRAARAGVAQAAYNLGVLYESNFVGAIDLAKALEWYEIAQNDGHADAGEAVARLKEDIGDQGLTLADMVEPASGDEATEGQGDASEPGEDSANVDRRLLMKIQTALAAKGYLPSKPSGRYDPQTEDAIRAFQSKTGVTADGIPTEQLLTQIQTAK